MKEKRVEGVEWRGKDRDMDVGGRVWLWGLDARRKKFPVKLLTDAAARLETSAEVAQGLSLTLGHSLSLSLLSFSIPFSAQKKTMPLAFIQNCQKTTNRLYYVTSHSVPQTSRQVTFISGTCTASKQSNTWKKVIHKYTKWLCTAGYQSGLGFHWLTIDSVLFVGL